MDQCSVFVLSNMVATSHMWPLSTRNVACEGKELHFYFILFMFQLKETHVASGSCMKQGKSFAPHNKLDRDHLSIFSQAKVLDPDAGKDSRWEGKGATEDEMVGWHHRLNGHEFE